MSAFFYPIIVNKSGFQTVKLADTALNCVESLSVKCLAKYYYYKFSCHYPLQL